MVESATIRSTLTPQRSVTVEHLLAAVEMVKAMEAKALDRDEGYRSRGRRASADRFAPIAHDAPAHGGSDPRPLHRPQIPNHVDAATEMVDALGVETAAVFGRYTGDAIAIDFANRSCACSTRVVFEGWTKRRLLGSGAGV